MLYITARDPQAVHTVHWALTHDRGPEGGLFLPFHLPRFTEAELAFLLDQPFCGCVAEILNRFFRTKLTAYDLSFRVGKRPVRVKELSHRILIAELWHNPGEDFSWLANRISGLLLPGGEAACAEWTQVAVRIAMLIGIYGELIRSGKLNCGEVLDISLPAGDFSAPMAVWYARAMGLPIGTVVCTCNENHSLWELFHQGSLRTDCVAVPTALPEVDVAVPPSLERLIHACGGYGESLRYLEVCRRGGSYRPNEVLLRRLRTGFSISVVSEKRTYGSMKTVHSTYGCLMEPYTALAYAGLLDHRGRTGQSRWSLVLSEKKPSRYVPQIAQALGCSAGAIQKQIDRL